MRIFDRPARSWPARRLAGAVALGAALYSVAGVIFIGRWMHLAGQPIVNLGFGYGVLLEALEKTGVYRVCNVHYEGICFSAHRLPLIPYLMLALRRLVGDDLQRIDAAKSLLFNSALATGIYLLLRRCTLPLKIVLPALGVPLVMPRWILNAFELNVEEGYIIGVLTLVFAMLLFPPDLAGNARKLAWAVALGLLAVVLLFCKNSMIYWAAALPCLLGLRLRHLPSFLAAAAVVAVGFLALVTFNHQVSGRYTAGSSWEGWNLYKGNNVHSAELYPTYNLDNLDYMGLVVADRPLKDEWDYNDYFKGKAVAFIKANPGQFLNLCARKAWVFFVEVRQTGLRLGEHRMDHSWLWFQAAFMAAYRIIMWWTIALSLRLVLRRANPFASARPSAALLFLVFLALYAPFHVIGFTYERHIMPVILPTIFVWLALLQPAAPPGQIAPASQA